MLARTLLGKGTDMKLYNVPRNTKVRILEPGSVPPAARVLSKDEVILFHRVDGMYSYCTDSKGDVVHLAAFTEVEIVV